MTKKDYVYSDLCRHQCAVLIVFIHTCPPAGRSHTADRISADITCRLAVPFFFMTAGYWILFLQTACRREMQHFPPVLKNLRNYLIWSLFNYFIDLIRRGRMDIVTLLKKCLIDSFSSGSGQHLWFMTALLFSSVTAYLFQDRPAETASAAAFLLLFLPFPPESHG